MNCAGFGCIDGDKNERLRRERERLGSLTAVYRQNKRAFMDRVNFDPEAFDELLAEVREEIEQPRNLDFGPDAGAPSGGPRSGRCALSTEDRLFIYLMRMRNDYTSEVCV